jgi:hypothetical protein
MRHQRQGRVAAGSYRRLGPPVAPAPAGSSDDAGRSVLKVFEVVGSVASDDGNAARVRLQTSYGEADLEIGRSDLASLQAAITLAQQRCEEKSAPDRRFKFAHTVQALALDETSDADMVLLTMTLDAEQRMSSLVQRSALDTSMRVQNRMSALRMLGELRVYGIARS